MGWSIGFDTNWQRDIGYGVPAICDHPDCAEEIDRGLECVCGSEPHGGDRGCGLYFCSKHLHYAERLEGAFCKRCHPRKMLPFVPKPDVPQWLHHKLHDESWQAWRDENPKEVAYINERLAEVWTPEELAAAKARADEYAAWYLGEGPAPSALTSNAPVK
jgi:hypothetical protein